MYNPSTATPFKKSNNYKEVRPCGVLEPYVKCYWGNESPYICDEQQQTPELIIPDTCVDIMYFIDYTDNSISGGFCGVSDVSFYSKRTGIPGHRISIFSIRFFAWSAYMFSEDSLAETVNGFCEINSRFEWLDCRIKEMLFEKENINDRVTIVEQLLVNKIGYRKSNLAVDTAINTILMHQGNIDIVELAKTSFVSTRQLERLFKEYVGITPKKLSNLIKYQYIWNDVLYNRRFNIQDAVFRYGFTDESHLLHEFKRYHSTSISNAMKIAYSDVGNIQDNKLKIH